MDSAMLRQVLNNIHDALPAQILVREWWRINLAQFFDTGETTVYAYMFDEGSSPFRVAPEVVQEVALGLSRGLKMELDEFRQFAAEIHDSIPPALLSVYYARVAESANISVAMVPYLHTAGRCSPYQYRYMEILSRMSEAMLQLTNAKHAA